VHDNGLADPAEAMAGNLHQILSDLGEFSVLFYFRGIFPARRTLKERLSGKPFEKTNHLYLNAMRI
jgi:hypothetical protein